MTTGMVILLVIAILAIATAVWFFLENQRTRKLRGRFGPESESAIEDNGSARRAEQDMISREKRVEKLHIRPLSPEESSRYAEAWRIEQERFVDDPRGAVRGADLVITGVMRAKGYSMSDFEQRIADISVDHADVAESYRAAHAIAVRDRSEGASTEDLRQAMNHYRVLFEHLAGAKPVREQWEVRR
jgi:hypothetical protein